MERKRRASSEVQELMNAVKSDYEFFAKFSSSFQSSTPTKSHRTLSDNFIVQNTYARARSRNPTQKLSLSKSDMKRRLNQLSKYSEETSVDQSLDVHQTLPGLIQTSEANVRRQSCDQFGKSRGQALLPEKNEQSGEYFLYPREKNESRHEQMFQITTPDFWAIHDEETSRRHNPYSFTSKMTRSISESNSKHDLRAQITNPGEFICLSSESFTSRSPESAVARKIPTKVVPQKTKYVPTSGKILNEPPLLIRVDTDTTREFSAHETRVPENTRSSFRGFPVSKRLDPNTPTGIQRMSVEEEKETKVGSINTNKTEKPATELHPSDSEDDELIIVDSTPNSTSCEMFDHEGSADQNAKNNQLTNESHEENECLSIEHNSLDSPAILNPSNHICSEHVVTRVGSLLWLDKNVVYPITLDEMKRRVQDPENFSFQMLIAYVRHSRAKGRQFLNYWKCQPSKKTSRPNVLSKLCEADAKELVKGIQEINEDYFPQEILAKTLADNIVLRNGNSLTANEVEANNDKETAVKEKVKIVEKSRSVFRILQETLSEAEDDDRFTTFNVASHNAGVENIRNSLKFLDSIFERMQNHMQQNHKNLPALTA